MPPMIKRFLIPFFSSFITFLLCTFALQNQQAIKEFLFYPAVPHVYPLLSLTLTLQHSVLWTSQSHLALERVGLFKDEGRNVISLSIDNLNNSIDLIDIFSGRVALDSETDKLTILEPLTPATINNYPAQIGKVKVETTFDGSNIPISIESIYTIVIIPYESYQVICIIRPETPESLDILHSLEISSP